MRLINKNNFISIVCISFTLVVCGKLILEKAMGITDKYYTENIFTCLGFSVIISLILSLHYHLQSFPFIPVLIGQYAVLIGIVFLFIWVAGHFTTATPTAYRDMVISVTVPYIIGAAIYYLSFFREIKKANKMIDEMNQDYDT